MTALTLIWLILAVLELSAVLRVLLVMGDPVVTDFIKLYV